MMVDLSPLGISLKVAGLATTLTFFLGIGVAYGMLGYRGRWKPVLESILIAPLILPPTVVGFFLLILLGKHGPLGAFLARWDITVVFTWYAAVISATVVAFPLMYKTTLGSFEQVDPRLLQVAQTLGASQGRIFWRVLLPLAFPGILAGTVLAFARALGEFGATLMLAGNIPGQTQTLPMAIYFAVEAGAFGEAWGWVGIMMVISLLGLMAVNLGQRRGTLQQPPDRMEWGEAQGPQDPQDPQDLEQGEAGLSGPPSPPHQGLWVELEKPLATFTLKTAFTAHQETLGILGGSGSGKTMTLRCLAGVETPTQGRILLNGRTLFDADRRINVPSHQRRISLVFQNYALFPHMTVAQNIAFGLPHLAHPLRSQRVDQHLALMQLQGKGDRYPHQLSGGQQQRVALARALATEPDVLLLDEPFSALDTHLRSQMERHLIQTLATYRGVTLFVTHNLEEAYRLCERLMVMSRGRAIALDTKQRIFEHPRTLRVAQLTGCKNFSRATAVTSDTIQALDWGVTLDVREPIPPNLVNVGMRAHHIQLMPQPVKNGRPQNHFPCWLAALGETPHRMTLYLKLNQRSLNPQDYHLQAELFKEKWYTLKDHPQPWWIRLDPLRLMLLEGSSNDHDSGGTGADLIDGNHDIR